jgi:CRP/FNR family transcriptional regulator, cyclic AMP receptor protein
MKVPDDEWIKTLEDGRKVKFIYQELPEDGAFITAQVASNEVVYSVVLTQARNPLSREEVESHFKGDLSKRQQHPNGGAMKAIASSSKVRSKKNPAFNVRDFLKSAGLAKRIVEYQKSQKIYSQGDPANHVLYIQTGGIKLTVVNEVGKEAVVGVLGPGDFFGDGGLAGQPVRMGTATAIAPTALLVIEKQEMIRVLHAERAFSDRFVAYMLARNIRIEQDLIDQLFNSSEKRLARTLLLLARYGKQDQPQKMLPKVSQEMLAEMIGTTRSRVNFFMNKFRKLGFIKYNGGLHINTSLLSVVLHE